MPSFRVNTLLSSFYETPYLIPSQFGLQFCEITVIRTPYSSDLTHLTHPLPRYIFYTSRNHHLHCFKLFTTTSHIFPPNRFTQLMPILTIPISARWWLQHSPLHPLLRYLLNQSSSQLTLPTATSLTATCLTTTCLTTTRLAT